MKNIFFYDTELGKYWIADNGEQGDAGKIQNFYFSQPFDIEKYQVCETDIIRQAGIQLKEYIAGTRRTFDLPFDLKGTEFEKSVWNALLTIPYGEIRSYKDIAEQVGRPKACRAVGRANGLNPIAIFIPCHRVVGSNKSLTGFAGGLEIKKRLLELENIEIDDRNRIVS